MANDDELWAGEIIDGAYAIETRVGVGGMGTVYRARDVDLDRIVAVKVMPSDWVGDAERVARFKLEARALAGLTHPNLATVFDVARKRQRPYFVMQWIDGRPLRAWLNESPNGMPSERVVRIIEQVGAALNHAHSNGVVHLDVAPGNVMLDDADHATLVDFGLGRPAADAREFVRGTAAYMAPEQADPKARLGPKTDVYALGALTYTLLVGHPPYRGTALEILKQHRAAPIPSLMGSPALNEVIRHALAKAPEARPTVAAFTRALRNLNPSGRRVERVRVNRHFEGSIADDYVADVSWTGCFIRMRRPQPVGTRLPLFHPILDAGGQVLAGLGEVHRRQDNGVGVRYLRLSAVGEAAISAVLKH